MGKSEGIGICTVVFIVFLVLKLVGVIDWSWWWVTAPLWISLIVSILMSIFSWLFIKNSMNSFRETFGESEKHFDSHFDDDFFKRGF